MKGEKHDSHHECKEDDLKTAELIRADSKPCPNCGTNNPVGAKKCCMCGHSFSSEFNLKLDEALRTGAIIRGMDIPELEVVLAEGMAENVRAAILQSGDARLIKLLK